MLSDRLSNFVSKLLTAISPRLSSFYQEVGHRHRLIRCYDLREVSQHMQNDYYVLAHEQAAKERAELRAQIEKLLARDGKLEKLLDCLKEFFPVEASASIQQAEPEARAQEHVGA